MPYPEALDSANRRAEVLYTEASMQLLAHCALKHMDYRMGVAELEEELRATNTYLPMPLEELEERQQQYIDKHKEGIAFDSAQERRLSIDEAAAFCLHTARTTDIIFRRGHERLHRSLEAHKFRLPLPVSDLVDKANFKPFCQHDEVYTRPTQAIVLDKKVIGMLIQSEPLPGADRAWRAYADIDERNPDGSKAPPREIMYGYDGDDPSYNGLQEGSLVVVALPGARLLRPDGKIDKLRRRSWKKFGIVSNGMFCSKREACDQPLMHFVQGRGWEQDTVLTLRASRARYKGAHIRTIREIKESPKSNPILEIQTKDGPRIYQAHIT